MRTARLKDTGRAVVVIAVGKPCSVPGPGPQHSLQGTGQGAEHRVIGKEDPQGQAGLLLASAGAARADSRGTPGAPRVSV